MSVNGRRWCGTRTRHGVFINQEKEEILPFAVTWVDLEGGRLREVSQRKTNTVRYHLHVEAKDAELVGTGGYKGVGDERSWRPTHSTVTSPHCTTHFTAARKLDLNCFQDKKEMVTM